MIAGFDVVIGNPPYISAPMQIADPTLRAQREYLAKCGRYRTLHEKWDLYIPFIELGTQLCRPGGMTHFARQGHKTIRLQLGGIVFDSHAQRLRNCSAN